ncbi:phosphoglycerate kinase [Elusimicrobiota bacterium]
MNFEKLDVSNKRVLLRVDYNVAIKDGKVVEPKRIVASLPTIKNLLERDAKIVIMSHLGRPKGKRDKKYSMAPVFEEFIRIAQKEELPIHLCEMWDGDLDGEGFRDYTSKLKPGDILFIENLRFWPGEEANDEAFARSLASLGEVFVQEAFGALHRAHASTDKLARLLPSAFGLLVQKELAELNKLLADPQRPFVALLGGAKVKDKIGAIENLIARGVDKILIGGALAYTFLKAQGVQVGDSFVDEKWVDKLTELMKDPKKSSRIEVCVDHKIAKDVNSPNTAKTIEEKNIPDGCKGMDIGPKTLENFKSELGKAKTIFWNGPVGMMEVPPFDTGSSEMARVISGSTKNGALSVLGGGDTIYAVSIAGLKEDDFSHVSTGGGATLEFLEGKTLPGVAAIQK